MSADAVAILGFVVLFALMLLRVPVGMAMGLVGVTGYSVIVGPGPALKLVGQTSLRTVTDYTFGVIPMFMLMGALVSVSGVSRELFKAANSTIGHFRGGLGVATDGDQEAEKLAEHVLYVPKVLGVVIPLVTVLPLQLLAYYIADLKGTDVDQPRNLAKTVTVE